MTMHKFVVNYRKELIIFFIALAARLFFFAFFYPAFGHDNFIKGDAIEYLNIAQNIWQTGTFSNLTPPSSVPTISDGPLYPLFLLLTGSRFHFMFPLIFQLFIGALTAVLVYKLSMRAGLKKSAWLASSFFVLEPGILFFTSQIFTETLFLFFFLLGLYYISDSELRTKHVALAAFFLALATLARSIALYSSFVLLIYIIVVSLFKKEALRPIVFKTFAFAGIFLIIISPWVVRNKKSFNVYTISSGEEISLAAYAIPAYFSWHDRIGFHDAQIKVQTDYAARGIYEDFDRGTNFNIRKEFLKIVSSDPAGYIWSQIRFSPEFFISSGWQSIVDAFQKKRSEVPRFGEMPAPSAARILGSGFWLVLTLLALAGILRTLNAEKNNRILYILFALIIFEFAFLTGSLAHSRYRFPVNPIIFLFAANAIYEIKTLFPGKEQNAA